MPTISPGCTEKSTRSTARMPPKEIGELLGHQHRRRRCVRRVAVRDRGVVLAPVAVRRAAGREPGARPLEEHRSQHVGPVEQFGRRPAEAHLALLEEARRCRRPAGRRSRTARRGRPSCRRRRRRRRAASSCGHDRRRQPERELVDEQQAGLADQGHGEGEHLLLSAATGRRRRCLPVRQGRGTAPGHGRAGGRPRRGRARTATPAIWRFSATVSVGKTPDPPGTWATPRAAISFGRRVGDLAAVEQHDAAIGFDDAGDGAQQRRLAGAVRAEEGDALALGDLEVDAEEDLHAAVADVEAPARSAAGHGPASRSAASAGPCRRRLPHLGDVVGDRVLRAGEEEPADEEGGDHEQACRRGGRSDHRPSR